MRTMLSFDRGVSLPQLLPGANYFFGQPSAVHACCNDSRHCREGDLFVALLGEDQDGHDFAAEAVANGASAVLCERPLPVGVPNCIVEDTRTAYGHLCQALAGDPSQRLRSLGVTGSFGKTTTSLLLASLVEASGEAPAMLTSLGACDGVEVDPGMQSISSSPALARWLGNAQQNGVDQAILEMSSVDLAKQTVAGVALDGAVITNVRRAHLDLHGSVLNYRRIKQRIFDLLKPEGFVVMNADDPQSKFFLSKINHPVLTYGMQADAEVTGTLMETLPGEQTFMLRAGSDMVPVRTRMIGQHHIYNCLAAAATGLVLGMDLETIARGLENVDTLPGRLEQISSAQPFNVFVDTASSSDSLATVLKSLRRVTPKRLICVFGAPGGGNHDQRPLLGRVVERGADLGIVTSNNPRNEDPQQIAHDVIDGYDRPALAHLIPDRARAIGWALHQAEEGDTVLIAGKGAALEEIAGDERVHFDDREVAKFFLRELEKSRQPRAQAA
ncbi:MAG: UDP-N-acetylmuramoyl-L-alanyl-D-glutamate--2,6-diaminopimelate ligase [Planctomycetota bacterium]